MATMGSIESSVPYVVSADIAGLIGEWAEENQYISPSKTYLSDVSLDLKDALEEATKAEIIIVEEELIRSGLVRLIEEIEYPVVSLDRAYVKDTDPNLAGFFDMTRAVDKNFNGIGIHPRPGALSINNQLFSFANYSGTEQPIALVDDVVFSGEGIVEIAQKFAEIGRPVRKIITGVGITEGIELVEKNDIEISVVTEFDEVIDEVCERDFISGVPMSGRTVIDGDVSWSAPYFAPFGDAVRWASIPDEAERKFSEFCLRLSVQLWKDIEAINGDIPTTDIPRPLRPLSAHQSISKALSVLMDEERIANLS